MTHLLLMRLILVLVTTSAVNFFFFLWKKRQQFYKKMSQNRNKIKEKFKKQSLWIYYCAHTVKEIYLPALIIKFNLYSKYFRSSYYQSSFGSLCTKFVGIRIKGWQNTQWNDYYYYQCPSGEYYLRLFTHIGHEHQQCWLKRA